MQRTHIIMETGELKPCSAKIKCPVSNHHYDSVEEAGKAYEAMMSKRARTIKTINRKNLNGETMLEELANKRKRKKSKLSVFQIMSTFGWKKSNVVIESNIDETNIDKTMLHNVVTIFPKTLSEKIERNPPKIIDNNVNVETVLANSNKRLFFGSHNGIKNELYVPGGLLSDIDEMNVDVQEYVNNFVSKTLAHELVHAMVQRNEEVMKHNSDFLNTIINQYDRTVLEKDNRSVVFETGFSDKYMGRKYFNGDTEILTRGVEKIFFEDWNLDSMSDDDKKVFGYVMKLMDEEYKKSGQK